MHEHNLRFVHDSHVEDPDREHIAELTGSSEPRRSDVHRYTHR